MSGFGDELNSVLQSPLTQTLAPAILGGVGGALSAPPVLGRRGAIGYGLQGGAQGLERGMELAGQQKELAVRQQEAQQRFALAQEQLKHVQLTDELAQRAIQGQDKSLPTLRNILKQASQSPAGKVVFGGLSDDAINNLDYDTATKLLDTYQKSSAEVLKSGKLPNGRTQVMGDRTYWVVENKDDPSHPFMSDVGPAPQKEFAPQRPELPFASVGITPEGNAVTIDKRTGALTTSETKMAPKGSGKSPPTEDETFNKDLDKAAKVAGVTLTGPSAMHPVQVDDATGNITYSTEPGIITGPTTRTVHMKDADKHMPNVPHVNSRQGNKNASAEEDDLVNEHSGK